MTTTSCHTLAHSVHNLHRPSARHRATGPDDVSGPRTTAGRANRQFLFWTRATIGKPCFIKLTIYSNPIRWKRRRRPYGVIGGVTDTQADHMM